MSLKIYFSFQADAVVKTDTHHDSSLKRIEELESADKFGKQEISEKTSDVNGLCFTIIKLSRLSDVLQVPPRFTQAFSTDSIDLEEGQPLHLDAKVEPYDNNLIVEWYHEDHLVPTGKYI